MRLEHFQLIDRVLSLSLAERRITALATVPMGGTILDAHFPGYPLMPGVLLVEAMAQTSGWLAIAAENFARMAVLAQIKEAKLRAAVLPGQSLTIEAELVHAGSGYAVTRASIAVDGKKASEAELTLRLLPFPNETLASEMRQAAARLGILDASAAGQLGNG